MTKPMAANHPPATQAALEALDKEVNEVYAHYRPLMVRCFARFVYDRGPGSSVPVEYDGVRVSLKVAGKSWQHVGRTLFGQDFVDAFKALVVEEARKTAKGKT